MQYFCKCTKIRIWDMNIYYIVHQKLPYIRLHFTFIRWFLWAGKVRHSKDIQSDRCNGQLHWNRNVVVCRDVYDNNANDGDCEVFHAYVRCLYAQTCAHTHNYTNTHTTICFMCVVTTTRSVVRAVRFQPPPAFVVDVVVVLCNRQPVDAASMCTNQTERDYLFEAFMGCAKCEQHIHTNTTTCDFRILWPGQTESLRACDLCTAQTALINTTQLSWCWRKVLMSWGPHICAYLSTWCSVFLPRPNIMRNDHNAKCEQQTHVMVIPDRQWPDYKTHSQQADAMIPITTMANFAYDFCIISP